MELRKLYFSLHTARTIGTPAANEIAYHGYKRVKATRCTSYTHVSRSGYVWLVGKTEVSSDAERVVFEFHIANATLGYATHFGISDDDGRLIHAGEMHPHIYIEPCVIPQLIVSSLDVIAATCALGKELGRFATDADLEHAMLHHLLDMPTPEGTPCGFLDAFESTSDASIAVSEPTKPVLPTRPDGFDQTRIDEIKGTMLATRRGGK